MSENKDTKKEQEPKEKSLLPSPEISRVRSRFPTPVNAETVPGETKADINIKNHLGKETPCRGFLHYATLATPAFFFAYCTPIFEG